MWDRFLLHLILIDFIYNQLITLNIHSLHFSSWRWSNFSDFIVLYGSLNWHRIVLRESFWHLNHRSESNRDILVRIGHDLARRSVLGVILRLLLFRWDFSLSRRIWRFSRLILQRQRLSKLFRLGWKINSLSGQVTYRFVRFSQIWRIRLLSLRFGSIRENKLVATVVLQSWNRFIIDFLGVLLKFVDYRRDFPFTRLRRIGFLRFTWPVFGAITFLDNLLGLPGYRHLIPFGSRWSGFGSLVDLRLYRNNVSVIYWAIGSIDRRSSFIHCWRSVRWSIRRRSVAPFSHRIYERNRDQVAWSLLMWCLSCLLGLLLLVGCLGWLSSHLIDVLC